MPGQTQPSCKVRGSSRTRHPPQSIIRGGGGHKKGPRLGRGAAPDRGAGSIPELGAGGIWVEVTAHASSGLPQRGGPTSAPRGLGTAPVHPTTPENPAALWGTWLRALWGCSQARGRGCRRPPQGIGDGKPPAHIMLSPQKPSSRAGGAGPGGLVRQWGTRARQQARGRREELAEVRVLESF